VGKAFSQLRLYQALVHTDPQGLAVQGMGFANDTLGAFQADEEPARLFEQLGASGRELQPARRPGEEHNAQPLLKIPDSARQRGLVDVDALGGAAEVELFGNGNEVAEVAQFNHVQRFRTDCSRQSRPT